MILRLFITICINAAAYTALVGIAALSPFFDLGGSDPYM